MELDKPKKKNLHSTIEILKSTRTYDGETRSRELRALVMALRELKCNRLLVIPWDQESIEEVGGTKVEVILMWQWMLE